jgi:hypothetical protein
MTVNLTLDFNCIISLENKDEFSNYLQSLVNLHDKDIVNLSVPAISASEKLLNGEYVDNIQKFLDRIYKLSKRKFEVLRPRGIWGMTYWDYCVWDGEALIELEKKIHKVLFPKLPFAFTNYANLHHLNPDILTPKWRNPKCDVISMWCHIYYQKDIFVTNDDNFHKHTKKEPLIELGAKNILRPFEIIIDLGYENN